MGGAFLFVLCRCRCLISWLDGTASRAISRENVNATPTAFFGSIQQQQQQQVAVLNSKNLLSSVPLGLSDLQALITRTDSLEQDCH